MTIKQISIFIFFISAISCTTTCSGTMQTNSQTTKKQSTKGLLPTSECISGERAYSHIEKIIEFGPRHAGTKGLEKTRQYIYNTLKELGLSPNRHDFTGHTPHPEIGSVEMANIWVDIGDTSEKFIILSGHFDGIILEEGSFYGANDGGSSTGLLLEKARCLLKHPMHIPVRIVFFDGEEATVKWSDTDSLYGSKNYVAKLAKNNELKKIAALVNVDMVADPNLRFMQDTNSTKWVFEALRQTAIKLGEKALFEGPVAAIEDDHLPFVRSGVPAAVLIDLQFGPGWNNNSYWHTPLDNLDNISAKSMTRTGRIVIETLPALFNHNL